MLFAIYSAVEKISTADKTTAVFFLPIKTAANAVHPIPLEIFGTKEESLSVSTHPEIEAIKAATIQATKQNNVGFTPRAFSTSESLPVIRIYKPAFEYRRNKDITTRISKHTIVETIRTFAVFNVKYSDVKTPRVPNILTEKNDTNEFNKRFIAIAAIKEFALNLCIT